MRRQSYKKYLFLGAVLFLLASLPMFFVERVRAGGVRISTSLFGWGSGKGSNKTQEWKQLEGENHLLRTEIAKLRTLLDQREKTAALGREGKAPYLSPKKCDEIEYLLGLSSQAVPARVIYRDPGSWSSTLWVNVGEETNRLLKRPVIQKNSPVILGRGVVGTVDYVGKKQARIRLITDVALAPSVRVVRGFQQNAALVDAIESLLRHLGSRSDLNLSAQEKTALIASLGALKGRISSGSEGWYLAKGVLQGAATPICRSVNHTLRGIGFNYDFPDEEGPARDLITGKAINGEEGYPAMSLIRVSDLLVTTGMDGVFPPGLRVAEVTKVFPLREGAYTYEIEAVPVVGNLDTLQTVFIIPPVGYQAEGS